MTDAQDLAPTKSRLPDVAFETPLATGLLSQVGMSGIEVPVLVVDSEGHHIRTPARAEAFVSLEAEAARGIHMSRLFRQVQETLPTAPLTLSLMEKITDDFLVTHQGLSESASLSVQYSGLVRRRSLQSENWGWRSYPIRLSLENRRGQPVRGSIEVEVLYSSTCPASAALARHLIQDQFVNDFTGPQVATQKVQDWLGTSRGIVATPHAQRSLARVQVDLGNESENRITPLFLIDLLEDTLQTAVQTVVKREDEQQFALRNGQNLMFCEDAARRVQQQLLEQREILGFRGEFRHLESLHPHDAVARILHRK